MEGYSCWQNSSLSRIPNNNKRERAEQLYNVSQTKKEILQDILKKVEETKKTGNNREVDCTQGRETGEARRGIQPNKLYDSMAATVGGGGGVEVENKNRGSKNT